MPLNNLRPPHGATHAKKRIGRGQGSGNGKTAGRGHKGAKSRSGFHYKRGFHNPFRVEYDVVNLDTLGTTFDAGTVVTPDLLRERGLLSRGKPLKVLGRGDVWKALTVHAHKFSGKAAEKIAAAGGTTQAIG